MRNALQQLRRDVETLFEIQRSRIRRPGLRRDDEHLETSASRIKIFSGQ